MKKIAASLLVLTMLFFIPIPAFADADTGITIDGEEYIFSPPPFIVEGRTLVPMRAFFEALSAQVDWEANTKTAIGVRDGITVRIPIDSTKPTINGRVVPITVPAKIVDGRTFIPLRFVGEAFGDDVQWDGATRTITINRTYGTTPPADEPQADLDLLTGEQAIEFITQSFERTYVLFYDACEAQHYGEKIPFAQISEVLVQFWSEHMLDVLGWYYEDLYPGNLSLPFYIHDHRGYKYKLFSQETDRFLVEVTNWDDYFTERVFMHVELIRENGKWVNNGLTLWGI